MAVYAAHCKPIVFPVTKKKLFVAIVINRDKNLQRDVDYVTPISQGKFYWMSKALEPCLIIFVMIVFSRNTIKEGTNLTLN